MADPLARATSQLLHRPPGDPVAIVRHLLAVQAQDARAFPLALRARGSGFGASAVEAALECGELVRAWLLRGTIHLVAAEDHGWLLELTAPRALKASDRRLRELGVGERAVRNAVRAIGRALPVDREELRERYADVTPHLVARAAHEGVCVLGAGGNVVAAPARGPEGDLGARFTAAHADAGPEDLAAWAGVGVRAARAALDGLDPPPVEPVAHPPRLLGGFDEYVFGWRDHRRRQRGGIVRAVAVRDGRVETEWSRADPPPQAYADELADVEAFLSA